MDTYEKLRELGKDSFQTFLKYAGEDRWDYANFYLGRHNALYEAAEIVASDYNDHEPLT